LRLASLRLSKNALATRALRRKGNFKGSILRTNPDFALRLGVFAVQQARSQRNSISPVAESIIIVLFGAIERLTSLPFFKVMTLVPPSFEWTVSTPFPL